MQKRTFNATLLDGTYELYYDNAALYEFEEIHGVQPIQVIGKGELGPRALTHFVYTGLLHGDDRKAMEEVKRLIPVKQKDMIKLIKVIIKAVTDAYDIGDEPKKEPAKVKNSKADHQE